MIAVPHSGLTTRRCAELLKCGVREASRQLRAFGYSNRNGRWFPADAPHGSKDSWNAKAEKGKGL
jgi:hypothetical protein